MPLVSVYIRKDDFEAWQALEKKSEAISEMLNGKPIKMAYDPVKRELLGKPVGDLLVTTKGKPDINEMFEEWEKITGMKINGQQKANRNACSNLLKKYGREKLQQLIQGVAKAQSQEFAPQIANFTQLQAKQDSLILWGRKQAQEENNSEVVKI